MNGNAIVKVTIFVVLLIVAMYLSDILLSAFLHRPIEQIPAVVQFIGHGIMLALIFLGLKKYFSK